MSRRRRHGVTMHSGRRTSASGRPTERTVVVRRAALARGVGERRFRERPGRSDSVNSGVLSCLRPRPRPRRGEGWYSGPVGCAIQCSRTGLQLWVRSVSEAGGNRKPTKTQPLLNLSPRIIVFRPLVDQLPKLDVASSRVVAVAVAIEKDGAELLSTDRVKMVTIRRAMAQGPHARARGH